MWPLASCFTLRCKEKDTFLCVISDPAMVTNINLVPDMSMYPVSTPTLRLTCLADGNPLPNNNNFKWTFQNTDSNTTEEIVSLSNSLTLRNLKESHSGTYFCSVTNSLNLTHSSNITIIVNGTIPEPPLQLHCHSSPCGALQTCVEGGAWLCVRDKRNGCCRCRLHHSYIAMCFCIDWSCLLHAEVTQWLESCTPCRKIVNLAKLYTYTYF